MKPKFKIDTFFNKFIWLLPLIIVTIGTIYFVNLFERLHNRDLSRQMEEKYQITNIIQQLPERSKIINALLTLDGFRDTYTYLLTDDFTRVLGEKYHSKNCPFRFGTHPYQVSSLQDEMNTHERGMFKYSNKEHKSIMWEYRHTTVENQKYIIITGVSNYPLEPLDKELQISIGILLLVTAILNWILVGYARHTHTNAKRIDGLIRDYGKRE